MKINRRRFLKGASFLGGAGLLGLLTGSLFMNQCTYPLLEKETEKETRQKVKSLEDFPGYAAMAEHRLDERVEQAYSRLANCKFCPRHCGVNRLAGETGFCRTADKAVVFSYQAHYGEERPLVGNRGSGTIFFSNCNLRCVFCQNYPIAHKGRGPKVTDEQIAEMMIDLQRRGCHNINLVTPTHNIPQILKAVQIARKDGLKIPLCYNTSGYEERSSIELLDGIVDIYLPDMKFMDGKQSKRFSDARADDYPQKAQKALKEMHNQVGDLVTDQDGIAKRGLMVRHLVMPNRLAGTEEFVEWVAKNLDTDTYVNIMSQYRVEHKAFEYDDINRAIKPEEFVEAIDWAKEAGLTNLDDRSIEDYERLSRRVD